MSACLLLLLEDHLLIHSILDLFLRALWFTFLIFVWTIWDQTLLLLCLVLKIIKNVLRVLFSFGLIRFDFTINSLVFTLMCICACVRVAITLYYIHLVSLFHALIFVINISTNCWDWNWMSDLVLRVHRMRSSCCCALPVVLIFFSSSLFCLIRFHRPFIFCRF